MDIDMSDYGNITNPKTGETVGIGEKPARSILAKYIKAFLSQSKEKRVKIIDNRICPSKNIPSTTKYSIPINEYGIYDGCIDLNNEPPTPYYEKMPDNSSCCFEILEEASNHPRSINNKVQRLIDRSALISLLDMHDDEENDSDNSEE